MTVIVEETTDLTGLDFAIQCEVERPPSMKRCERAADWLVVFLNPLPCGAPLSDDTTLMCQPCWEEFEKYGTRCKYCRTHWPIGRVVVDKRPVNCGG